MPKLFGTNGIRGSAKTLFTHDFCIKIGQVYGNWLKKNGKTGWVAMAMDPRESSPRIKQAVAQGLAGCGFEILDEGVIPTPALTYFVKKSPQVAGGIMVTGSHIKADLNGVKLLVDGEEVNKVQEKQIEQMYSQLQTVVAANPVVHNENMALDMYLEMLAQMADGPYPDMRIIIDTANGTQTQVMPELCRRLNLDFSCEADIQSDYFVPRDTESTTSVSELSKKVLQEQADLGIAFDVDGDRVVFVDADGEFVMGDYSGTLIAQDYQGPIVTTISTSDVVENLDNEIFRTKIGATYVIDEMRKNRSRFGFEPNGGGIFADNFYGRDGGATMIAMLNILKKHRGSLSQALADWPKYYLYKDKFDCPIEKYPEIYAAVKDRFSDKKILDTDGLKVYLSDHEWVLFRGSGNAPEFRVFVQSHDEKTALTTGQKYLHWLKQLQEPHAAHFSLASTAGDSMGIQESIAAFSEQISQTILEMGTVNIPSEYQHVKNIVLAGMGGSALGGRVVSGLKSQVNLPFEIVTNFELPKYVDENTLVILSSYSGNTAETLSAAAIAITKGAKIFALGTGGKLKEVAEANSWPGLFFDPKANPSGMPRMGVGYSIMAVFLLLIRIGVIKPYSDLNSLASWIAEQQANLQQQAQTLAEQLFDKYPIFLASEHLIAAAHVCKNNLNENSKQLAFLFDLPEADHHLLEGLSFPKNLLSQCIFLVFTSQFYPANLQKQIAVTIEVLQKRKLQVLEIKAFGSDSLQEILFMVSLGQHLSFYLAQANGIDPGPIPWVDYIKERLS